MVGYVLLIVIAIAIAIAVFTYLRLYLPNENAECPSDISLIIKESGCLGGDVTLTVENRGLFSVDGIQIRAGEENRLLKQLLNEDNGFVFTGDSDGRLSPGEEWSASYDYNLTRYFELEIEPIVDVEDDNGVIDRVLCDGAVVIQRVTCNQCGNEVVDEGEIYDNNITAGEGNLGGSPGYHVAPSCSSGTVPPNIEIINGLPGATIGIYSVEGIVERGPQCQSDESFRIDVDTGGNIQQGIESEDPEDNENPPGTCALDYENEYLGEFNMDSGTTIDMISTAENCNGGSNSVALINVCIYEE